MTQSSGMLPIIGLALDLLGAITLAIGLFRAPTRLYPGWNRSPEEAATDRAFGTVGAGLLVVGFATQALPSFGVEWAACCAAEKALGLAATLGIGTLSAYGLYGFARIFHMRRLAHFYPDHVGLRKRQGLAFWHYDWVEKTRATDDQP